MRASLIIGMIVLSQILYATCPTAMAQSTKICDRNSLACDECASLDPCCNLCPCNYFVAEGLIMHRDNGTFSQPLVMDINTQQTLLSTDNLSPDTGGGFRILAGHRFNECYALELGYFKLFDMGDEQSVLSSDNLMMPGDLGLGAVNNFFGADQVDVRYTSNLQGAEANVVRCTVCCDEVRSVEWLAGFRYFNLAENFSLTAYDSAESTSTYNIKASNQLFGAQLGTRVRRCLGRWSLEATGKVGLYGNDARQHSDALLDFPNNFEVRPAVGASACEVAFASDINLTAIYQINRTWGIRSGYNVMWLDGVALAPDQLDFTNTPTSGTNIACDSTLFLHGVNLGLEARW